MPIATGTALAYAATLLTGLGAYWFAQRADDKDDEGKEDEPDGPTPRPPRPLPPPQPVTPLIPGTVDLDYMEEDEGDLTLEPDIVFNATAIDIDPDAGSGDDEPGYPYQSNPPPGAGYNAELFSDFNKIRRVLYGLGYNVPYASWGVQLQTNPEGSEVKRFQNHYNKASEMEYRDAKGYLKEDGQPGAKTLRALERAAFGTDGEDPSDLVRSIKWKWDRAV
jgi:hypothetical protein